MAENTLTRRSTLVLLGAAVCAGKLACGGTGSGDVPTTIAAGAASSFPPGSLQVVDGLPVGVGHDGGGLYALSLICTHAGCDMTQSGSVSPARIDCFCHGSVFSPEGDVLRGPAFSPLLHYALTKDAAGQLTVHTDRTVPPGTRV